VLRFTSFVMSGEVETSFTVRERSEN